ncbi:unnamed protein product [Linum tenue]|uniref:Uncharacterized protein n=1 Tax=Linum tenue TaxID=586396 RepID=A0AAV0R362_9ROSI|nr:unnamed protein product [Linum tenue]
MASTTPPSPSSSPEARGSLSSSRAEAGPRVMTTRWRCPRRERASWRQGR